MERPTDREREEFEAAARARSPAADLARRGKGYADPLVQARWEGWTERAASPDPEMFPLAGAAPIAWRAIAPCEERARALHGASLRDLARSASLTPFDALDLLSFRPAGHHRATLRGDAERAARELAMMLAAPAIPEGHVMVPIKPTPALLMSMAMRMDHALGMPGFYDNIRSVLGEAAGPGHAQRLDAAISQSRQLHEEVVGQGFYDPRNQSPHARTLALSASSAPEAPKAPKA